MYTLDFWCKHASNLSYTEVEKLISDLSPVAQLQASSLDAACSTLILACSHWPALCFESSSKPGRCMDLKEAVFVVLIALVLGLQGLTRKRAASQIRSLQTRIRRTTCLTRGDARHRVRSCVPNWKGAACCRRNVLYNLVESA